MKRLIASIVGLSLLGGAVFARAETQTPDMLVKNTVQEVVVALKQEKKDKHKIQALVDEKVLPLFDFTLMTKRAVGQPWRSATAEQKKALVVEFRDLLVRVFIAKAFTGNTDLTVKFEPSKYTEGDDQVTVRTQVLIPGSAPLAVDYDLKKTSAGWKVVDFAIAGPRLALDIYSNQFRDPLQQGGVDALVKFLMEKNRAADVSSNVIPVRKAELK